MAEGMNTRYEMTNVVVCASEYRQFELGTSNELSFAQRCFYYLQYYTLY